MKSSVLKCKLEKNWRRTNKVKDCISATERSISQQFQVTGKTWLWSHLHCGPCSCLESSKKWLGNFSVGILSASPRLLLVGHVLRASVQKLHGKAVWRKKKKNDKSVALCKVSRAFQGVETFKTTGFFFYELQTKPQRGVRPCDQTLKVLGISLKNNLWIQYKRKVFIETEVRIDKCVNRKGKLRDWNWREGNRN